MKPYELVADICKEKFNFTIGEELGSGNQGQVFEILENPNQIIKISILFDTDPYLDLDIVFDKVQAVFKYLIDHQTYSLCKVHRFGRLLTGSRPTVYGPQDYIVYFSIQEKLLPLEDDENKLFKTICQALSGELDSERTVEEIAQELSAWLTFDPEKVLKFYRAINNLPIEHNDFRVQNILKDSGGNFKLIDFDLARLV